MFPLPVVDILIPVYNEGENIRMALQGIKQQVLANYKIHILYDFDEDNTIGPAKDEAERLGLSIGYIKNKHGRGVLNAIKSGFEDTKAEWVVVTMADLSDPPEVINRMLEKANSENLDIVCASRYMAGGQQIGGPVLKKLLSKMAGLSLNVLLGIPTKDITNNFKLYSRRVIKAVAIESTGGFELGMEMVIKAYFQGFAIGEVPTTWRDRSAGESRFLMSKWLPKYLKWYFYGFEQKLKAK